MARKRARLNKGGRPRIERTGPDRGTPEQQLRRALLAGPGTANQPPDPVMTSTPLDILKTRGLISLDQHSAGLDYATLYAKFTGRYRDAGLEPEGQGEPSEDAEAEVERKYRACAIALLSLGRRVKDATDNLVIYRRMPAWLQGASQNPSRRAGAERERQAAIQGLTALAMSLFGKTRKAA